MIKERRATAARMAPLDRPRYVNMNLKALSLDGATLRAAAMHLAIAVGVVVFTLLLGTLLGGCAGKAQAGSTTCGNEASCADGLVCQDGECITSCNVAGCERGLCDTESGACVDCFDTSNCPDGLVCNDITKRCVTPLAGCSSDDECSGQRCDLGKGTCVQCLADTDCGLGLACDLLTSSCAEAKSCVSDGDCLDSVCDPNVRVCVDCYDDVHCGQGTCDRETSTCVVGCVDADPTEPNANDDAVSIASGGAHEGTICPGDIDEFVLEAEGTITATLNIDGAASLQLRLVSGSGSLVADSAPSGTGRALTANVSAGTYRFIVNGATGADSGAYLLSVEVDVPAGCTQLDVEPNNSTAQATQASADNALRSGTICGGDIDVFRFSAAAGDSIEVAAVPGDGAGTLSVAVLDGGGSVVVTGNPATTTAAASGTYFARVTSTGGDVSYSLRIQATSAPPVCVQSDAEPNDGDTQALSLTPGTTSSGTICPGDVDKFRFAVAALDDVAVTITGTNLSARMVRASDGVQVATGLSMNVTDLPAGAYRIVVQGTSSSTQAAYTVATQLTTEPVSTACTEGGVEPDSRSAPRPLALDGTPGAGNICTSGDTDFFAFTLTANATVRVRTAFVDADGDLDIRLTDASGGVIASSSGVTNEEVIERTLGPGSYFVEIFGFNDATNTYSMEATLQGCLNDDAFEDNNVVARATPIAGATVSAARCPGDDDFYLLRLEGDDALDATLTGGGLTMSLVSTTNGALLASDAAAGGNRRLQVSGLPAGRYALRVTGSGAERIAYTLTPTITSASGRCIDDGAAANDSAAAAFPLSELGLQDGSYEVGALVSCELVDADWFQISLPAQKKVAVQLSFDPASDVDVELLEPRGTSAFTRSIARSLSTDAQDRVEGVVNAAGSYFIRAIGFESSLTRYEIGIEVSEPPASSCVDDRFDSWTATATSGTTRSFTNNTSGTAVELSSGEALPSLRVCPADEDWYKINATVGQRIVVHVAYAHAEGRDIDLRLFNSASQTEPNQVASSVGVDGTEDIDFAVVSSGNHFIKVFGFQNGENLYDLTVDVR